MTLRLTNKEITEDVYIIYEFPSRLGLNKVSYCVKSLKLKYMFSGEGEKRSVFVGCKFLMGNLDLRRTVRKVTYKSLTLLPECGSPGNHTNPTPTCNWLSQKKYNPPYATTPTAPFSGFISPSSEPPFLVGSREP